MRAVCVTLQLRKQNVELKRRSQQLLEKMQIVDINIDEIDGTDAVPDASTDDEDITQALCQKITSNYPF